MQYIKSNLLSLIAVLVVFVGSSYVFATSDIPTGRPPTNNVPAPINVGPNTIPQIKKDGLILNTLGAPNSNGLIVEKGNVGIGTPNPGAPLEIKASPALGQLRLTNAAGGWNYLEFYNNTARRLWLGMRDDNNFSINDQINLNTTNGNVGIGTILTGQLSKLDVNGIASQNTIGISSRVSEFPIDNIGVRGYGNVGVEGVGGSGSTNTVGVRGSGTIGLVGSGNIVGVRGSSTSNINSVGGDFFATRADIRIGGNQGVNMKYVAGANVTCPTTAPFPLIRKWGGSCVSGYGGRSVSCTTTWSSGASTCGTAPYWCASTTWTEAVCMGN